MTATSCRDSGPVTSGIITSTSSPTPGDPPATRPASATVSVAQVTAPRALATKLGGAQLAPQQRPIVEAKVDGGVDQDADQRRARVQPPGGRQAPARAGHQRADHRVGGQHQSHAGAPGPLLTDAGGRGTGRGPVLMVVLRFLTGDRQTRQAHHRRRRRSQLVQPGQPAAQAHGRDGRRRAGTIRRRDLACGEHGAPRSKVRGAGPPRLTST
jgi:hypothetical protein